jgi:hypothetical protein
MGLTCGKSTALLPGDHDQALCALMVPGGAGLKVFSHRFALSALCHGINVTTFPWQSAPSSNALRHSEPAIHRSPAHTISENK